MADHLESVSNPIEHDRKNNAALEALQTACDLSIRHKPITTPNGGGYFQALKQAAPGMSDEASSFLAHMMKSENGGKTILSENEALKLPTNSCGKSISADLRKNFGLPWDAPGSAVEDIAQQRNLAELRKAYKLPANASEGDIDKASAEHNLAELRKAYKLPANASEADIDKASREHNLAELRKAYKLPADASEADIDKASAEHNLAELRKYYKLPANASEADIDKASAEHNLTELRKAYNLPANATELK